MNVRLKRYLFVEQPIGAFVVNFALNALIAWALFRGAATVPMWGRTSVAGDTIATSFLLPFLTVLIATPLVRRDLQHGKVAAARGPGPRAVPRWLPRSLPARGVILGLAGVLIAAPLAIQGLHLAGVTSIAMPTFVWVKAAYAAVLGAVLAPWVAIAAVADDRGP